MNNPPFELKKRKISENSHKDKEHECNLAIEPLPDFANQEVG
jgi:hypothetical protein